jgi:hypothetical protein
VFPAISAVNEFKDFPFFVLDSGMGEENRNLDLRSF